MNFPKVIILIGIMLILLVNTSGCAKNVALKKTFWDKQGAKVGIALEDFPKAGAHRAGSQGVLDMAVSSGMDAGLRKYLEKTDLSKFLTVKKKFAALMHKGGLEPKIIDEFVDAKALPMVKNEQNGKSSPDYRFLAEKYDVDYILLLKINAVGTLRQYYGFIPLGSPQGYCVAGGLMAQNNTNEVFWAYTMDANKSVVKIEGKWNNPPDYPELDAAIQQSISNAVSEMEKSFQ